MQEMVALPHTPAGTRSVARICWRSDVNSEMGEQFNQRVAAKWLAFHGSR
jgi:hypothetical protein